MKSTTLGLILISLNRIVFSYNDIAGAILSEKKNMFVGPDRRLGFTNVSADILLGESLAAMMQGSLESPEKSTGILCGSADDEGVLICNLVPLKNPEVSERDRTAPSLPAEACMVLVIRPVDQTKLLSENILRSRYELTKSEMHLASALYNGTSVREYSNTNQLSVHTTRDRLKKVFAKTNTHRQAQLVSLLKRYEM